MSKKREVKKEFAKTVVPKPAEPKLKSAPPLIKEIKPMLKAAISIPCEIAIISIEDSGAGQVEMKLSDGRTIVFKEARFI